MKRHVPVFVAVLALLVALGAPASASAAKQKRQYYVALGDSLSVGVQAKAGGGNKVTDQGYADLLARRTGLKLRNFGCGGATSRSVIVGARPCSPKQRTLYANKGPKTSQLAAAERFLRRHRGQVAFVTIDIGANDVASCAAGAGVDLDCVNKGVAAIKKNSPRIAKRLRKAAGKGTRLAVMDFYNPFLQRWLTDSGGQTIAALSVDLAREQVNESIAKAFRPSGFKVAQVARRFDTYVPFERTTTYKGRDGVPVAVARICELTWMCAAEPRGPNIHANRAGYKEISAAFVKALGRSARKRG